MKKLRCGIILVMILWTLAGCGSLGKASQPTETTMTEATMLQTESTAEPTTEPVTTHATEPPTEPPVDVEGAYWAVIEGICPIVTETGNTVTLASYLRNGYGAYPASCTMVDFDKDGYNEMVVSTTSQEASYIVLHYSEGDVFAFPFGFRSLECLKTDGTFLASSSAAQSSYCHLRFNGGRCIIVADAEEDNDADTYRIEGESSTKEAVADFAKRWYAKPDAVWTYLDMIPEESTEPPFQSYIQYVSDPNQPVYSGPGYDYSVVMTVNIAGSYTIVEESWDYEGNQWGKLKSGAGWIDLTDTRERNEKPQLLTAGFADNEKYGTDDYCFIQDFSEYAVPIVFQAGKELHFVELYAVEYDYDGVPQLIHLYSHGYMEPGKPVVIVLSFPGDMTTYAINFQNSQGEEFSYSIYISGRNGELVLAPLNP